MTEWFFNDHAAPAMILHHQSGRAQLPDDGSKVIRRRSEVEEIVPLGCVLLINFTQQVAQLRISFLISKIAGQVIDSFGKPLPQVRIYFRSREIADLIRSEE